jgi:transcriptional regulator with XRE-family HTH domain
VSFAHPAEAVRRRRLAADLSQAELARRSGVTQQAISLIEAGNSGMKLDTARALAQALEISLDELVSTEVSA